jgi:hypothetical protein
MARVTVDVALAIGDDHGVVLLAGFDEIVAGTEGDRERRGQARRVDRVVSRAGVDAHERRHGRALEPGDAHVRRDRARDAAEDALSERRLRGRRRNPFG